MVVRSLCILAHRIVSIFRELFFATNTTTIPQAFNNGIKHIYVLCTVLKVNLAKKALPGQAFFQRTRATQAKKRPKKCPTDTKEIGESSLYLIHSLYK